MYLCLFIYKLPFHIIKIMEGILGTIVDFLILLLDLDWLTLPGWGSWNHSSLDSGSVLWMTTRRLGLGTALNPEVSLFVEWGLICTLQDFCGE